MTTTSLASKAILDPDNYQNLYGIKRVLRWLFNTKGNNALLIFSLLSSLFSPSFVLSSYVGFVFGNVVFTGILDDLYSLTLLAILFLLIGIVADYFCNRVAIAMNSSFCEEQVESTWSHLIRSNLLSFNTVDKGAMVSTLTDVMETVQRYQLFLIQQIYRTSFVITFCILFLTTYHYLFVVIVSFFVMLTIVWPIAIARNARKYVEQEPEHFALVNDFVESSIQSGEYLKTRNLSGVLAKFSSVLTQYSVIHAGRCLILSFCYNFKISLSLFSNAALILAGGVLYFKQLIALEELVAVYVLSSMVVPRLDNVYKLFTYSQALSVSYGKLDSLKTIDVNQFSNVKREVPNALGRASELSLSIKEYRFPNEERVILENIALHFYTSKRYLICGASGSGKSTLADLISFVIQDENVSLTVNGQKLSEPDTTDYWRQLVLHDQNNLVLPQQSVRDNLTLFSQDYDQARLALAIDTLEFQECLTKSVHQLSGGEMQRLCFIRSFAREGAIYIFDEPTASLDPRMEEKMFSLLAELQHAIVLVVSHSEGNERYFDLKLTLEQGQLLESSARELD